MRILSTEALASEIPREAPRKPSVKLVHAISLIAAASWSSQLVAWVAMIAVARVLSPGDFGLIGMANIFLGLADVVGECGLRDAVIALPDIADEELRQINTFSILLGAGLFGLGCAMAHPLERFFRAEHLQAVVYAMSLALVINGFKYVPAGIAYREFRFKMLAQARAGGAIATAVASISGALLGAGYWSLVFGAVAGAMVCTLMILFARRVAFVWPNFRIARRALTLSFHILANRISWYAYSNSDFLVVGRILGKFALGSYNIAWSLSNRPVQIIADQVWQVLPSYLSNVQKDETELRRYVLTMSSALLLITLPASLGVSLLAKDIILATLGAKWMNSILPLRLIVLYMPLSSMAMVLVALLYVRGQSRFVMLNNIAAALYFPAAFFLASRWGTVGVAMMWPLLYPAVALPLYSRTCKEIHLPIREYMRAVVPALTGSAVMVAGLLLVRNVVPDAVCVYCRLAAEIIIGAGLYAGTLLLLHRKHLRTLLTVACESSA